MFGYNYNKTEAGDSDGKIWRERLQRERRRWFVGRQAECERFREALHAAREEGGIFWVFGPAGIGKTSLLREWQAIAQMEGLLTVFLDWRSIEPRPEAFLEALRRALGAPTESSFAEIGTAGAAPLSFFLDNYEAFQPLDDWLREVFLPEQPGGTWVVIASRHPPPLSWQADPGWGGLLRSVPLRNLRREEAQEYLRLRGIPEERHLHLLAITCGHPLALALAADLVQQRPDRPIGLEMPPEIFHHLLSLFLEEIPSPAHHAALEACALVRLLTEPLLAEMVEGADSAALFDWLRGLSFVEPGPYGLRPHDLVREILLADLRWRNPERYRELHRRAQAYYARRLKEMEDPARSDLLIDYMALHRTHPLLRPFFAELRLQWPEGQTSYVDQAKPSEWEELIGLVAHYEGEHAAQLAAYWFQRQPEGILVIREGGQRIAGFLAAIALERVDLEEGRADPAVRAALDYLDRYAPLRPGERALYFRFWMARDSYQSLSPAQSLIGVQMVRLSLTTPRLAFSFFPCADPEFWSPIFAYAEIPRLPEADFEIDGHRFGVYGQDWRAIPIPVWLARLGEKEIAFGTAPPPPPPEPVIVLREEDFQAAVRQALRDLHRPDRLAQNPLARSRLVLQRVGFEAPPAQRGACLRALLLEAVERLQASPRDSKRYQALYFTYVEPIGPQEQVAERLDLPYSTYRRYLKAAITQVAAALWELELSA